MRPRGNPAKGVRKRGHQPQQVPRRKLPYRSSCVGADSVIAEAKGRKTTGICKVVTKGRASRGKKGTDEKAGRDESRATGRPPLVDVTQHASPPKRSAGKNYTLAKWGKE